MEPAGRLQPARPTDAALVPGEPPSVARSKDRVDEIPVPPLCSSAPPSNRRRRENEAAPTLAGLAPPSSPSPHAELIEMVAASAICQDDIEGLSAPEGWMGSPRLLPLFRFTRSLAPAPLPLENPLQSAAAGRGTKPLQGRPPAALKPLIATRAVTDPARSEAKGARNKIL